MTKVFIGGSRRVSRLAAAVRQRLDRMIEQNFAIIVGDANGADKAVQNYLYERNYRNVEIFCSGEVPRNNLGAWGLRKIISDLRFGKRLFYTAKDIAMTDESTIGLMVWDGKSIGTLLNAYRLIRQQKKVVVYEVPNKRFWELKNPGLWEEFVSRYPFEIRNEVDRRATEEVNELPLHPAEHRLAATRSAQQSI
jgi:hypothetical protein